MPASADAPTPSQPPPAPGQGRELPAIARAAVWARLRDDPAVPPPVASGFLAEPHPVFVTIRNLQGDLRGCIGTLVAKRPSVAVETWVLAREAAFGDPRFAPVQAREFEQLRFEVSVVAPLEVVASPTELDPRRYGVVVSTEDGRRGALLPDIAGIDTVDQQLAIARRKAGIHLREPVRLQRFTVQSFDEAR